MEPAFLDKREHTDQPDRNRSIFNAAYYNNSTTKVDSSYSRKDFYKIWLISSECNLHFADKTIHITEPALIFSNPLVPYAYESLSAEGSGYWCIFKEEFIKTGDHTRLLQDAPLFNIGGNNVFLPDEEQLTRLINLYGQIIEELAGEYVYKYDVIKSYLNLIIHEGMKMAPSLSYQQPSGSGRIASLFLDLLERQFPIETPQQPMQLKKPGDFAYSLSVHVNHLNFAVKEITGKSTSTHIAERMISEAKTLLKQTGWTTADIAYSLGFGYANHFNNFFKKHTGTTPLSFRK